MKKGSHAAALFLWGSCKCSLVNKEEVSEVSEKL